MLLCGEDETPLDIMVQNMLFWHRQANDIGQQIQDMLLKDVSPEAVADEDALERAEKDREDRQKIAGLLETFLSCREQSQKCACDAAPYMHAKLQSMHIDHEVSGTIEHEVKKSMSPQEASEAYQSTLKLVPKVA
jgi:hypothetical protein